VQRVVSTIICRCCICRCCIRGCCPPSCFGGEPGTKPIPARNTGGSPCRHLQPAH